MSNQLLHCLPHQALRIIVITVTAGSVNAHSAVKWILRHFLVAVLVLNSVATPQTTQTQKASQSAKIKAEVQRRGIGEKSRVKVRLRNKE